MPALPPSPRCFPLFLHQYMDSVDHLCVCVCGLHTNLKRSKLTLFPPMFCVSPPPSLCILILIPVICSQHCTLLVCFILQVVSRWGEDAPLFCLRTKKTENRKLLFFLTDVLYTRLNSSAKQLFFPLSFAFRKQSISPLPVEVGRGGLSCVCTRETHTSFKFSFAFCFWTALF